MGYGLQIEKILHDFVNDKYLPIVKELVELRKENKILKENSDGYYKIKYDNLLVDYNRVRDIASRKCKEVERIRRML